MLCVIAEDLRTSDITAYCTFFAVPTTAPRGAAAIETGTHRPWHAYGDPRCNAAQSNPNELIISIGTIGYRIAGLSRVRTRSLSQMIAGLGSAVRRAPLEARMI